MGGSMLEFDENGVLPEGIHDCDEDEFRRLLVEAFPASATRALIAAGFQRFRDDALSVSLAGTQWVDGSYVTTKLDPNDIDLVTYVPVEHLGALEGSPAEPFIVELLAAGPRAQARYSCDSYLVAVAPPGHPLHASFEAARDYWRKWFGRMRTILGPDGEPLPSRSKGLLKMGLGDPDLQPDVATWGGDTSV